MTRLQLGLSIFRMALSRTLGLPWKYPVNLHPIQTQAPQTLPKHPGEGWLYKSRAEWQNGRNPVPVRPWNSLADLKSFLPMKTQLTHLWCFGVVLLRCPEASQIQWLPASLAGQMLPLTSRLRASLLDNSHLLSSSPPAALVLLSGERHVPSRKANYLPLPAFPHACTCAGDMHTGHSEWAQQGAGWWAENNRSDLTRVPEGMSDGDACVFSSPKIILISVLCCMRSRSGRAYRALCSSWQPCAL